MKSKIQEDMRTAMKARDKESTSFLRLILSEIVLAEKSRGRDSTEEELQATLKSYKKGLKKALSSFTGERLEVLQREVDLVSSYLPQESSEKEIMLAIAEVLGATEERSLGPLIGQVMKKVNSDGKTVSAFLREALK